MGYRQTQAFTHWSLTYYHSCEHIHSAKGHSECCREIIQAINQSIDQSIHQLSNQSIHQSVNWPINQWHPPTILRSARFVVDLAILHKNTTKLHRNQSDHLSMYLPTPTHKCTNPLFEASTDWSATLPASTAMRIPRHRILLQPLELRNKFICIIFCTLTFLYILLPVSILVLLCALLHTLRAGLLDTLRPTLLDFPLHIFLNCSTHVTLEVLSSVLLHFLSPVLLKVSSHTLLNLTIPVRLEILAPVLFYFLSLVLLGVSSPALLNFIPPLRLKVLPAVLLHFIIPVWLEVWSPALQKVWILIVLDTLSPDVLAILSTSLLKVLSLVWEGVSVSGLLFVLKPTLIHVLPSLFLNSLLIVLVLPHVFLYIGSHASNDLCSEIALLRSLRAAIPFEVGNLMGHVYGANSQQSTLTIAYTTYYSSVYLARKIGYRLRERLLIFKTMYLSIEIYRRSALLQFYVVSIESWQQCAKKTATNMKCNLT